MRSYPQLAAALVALLLGLSGCGGGDEEARGPERLTVYVSLPLTGPAAGEGRDAADGARLALADSEGEPGGAEIAAEFLDAGARGGGWSPATAAANARTATRDSTAIGYIGDFQSGATRASLPITNKAFLLQVSPASGAADLVSEFPGSDELSDLQTSGERTFGRVIPSDVQQAAAGAGWTAELGERTAAAVSDRTTFGKIMVTAFRDALADAGVRRGTRGLLYYGGYFAEQPASLTQSAPDVMVSDAELPPSAPATAQPSGTLATSAALDPAHLPQAGQEFAERFETEYGRPPGRYAAYGYEAMGVVLDAIGRSSDPADRQEVVEAFFETAGRDSILGQYSITAEGETTLGRMTGYEIGEGGRLRPAAELVVP